MAEKPLIKARILLIASLFLLTACSNISKRPQNKETPLRDMAAISSEELSRNEVVSFPTKFKVPGALGAASWDRGVLFAEHFLGSTPKLFVKSGEREVLTLETKSEHFKYSVERVFSGEGYSFSVTCTPSDGDLSSASLNASNLARFIKDGKLEVSLLSM